VLCPVVIGNNYLGHAVAARADEARRPMVGTHGYAIMSRGASVHSCEPEACITQTMNQTGISGSQSELA